MQHTTSIDEKSMAASIADETVSTASSNSKRGRIALFGTLCAAGVAAVAVSATAGRSPSSTAISEDAIAAAAASLNSAALPGGVDGVVRAGSEKVLPNSEFYFRIGQVDGNADYSNICLTVSPAGASVAAGDALSLNPCPSVESGIDLDDTSVFYHDAAESKVVHMRSGLCVTANGSEEALVLGDCDANDVVPFSVEYVTYRYGMWTIRSDNKCIVAADGETTVLGDCEPQGGNPGVALADATQQRFQLQSGTEGRCLEVNIENSDVVSVPCAAPGPVSIGSASQSWYIGPLGMIISYSTRQCLTEGEFGVVSVAPCFDVFTDSNSTSRWTFEAESGVFGHLVKNAQTGHCLTEPAEFGRFTAAACLTMTNNNDGARKQRFGANFGGVMVQFRNRLSGKCIDVPGASGRHLYSHLQIWDCDAQHQTGSGQFAQFSDQFFYIDHHTYGESFGIMKHALSGYCLDIEGSPPSEQWYNYEPANGARIQLFHCDEISDDFPVYRSDQGFYIPDYSGNGFQMRSQIRQSKCVDVWGPAATSNGDKLNIYDCDVAENAHSDQRWDVYIQA